MELGTIIFLALIAGIVILVYLLGPKERKDPVTGDPRYRDDPPPPPGASG